ncbi:MAG TPA: gamma-glutamyltransferase, partial [Acidimicrobiales bacterium]|nr:gamma-glutamyltransferase [Acidimicrobiales bacterium]
MTGSVDEPAEDPGDAPTAPGGGSLRAVGAVGVMAEQCLARSPRGVVLAAAPAAAQAGARALAAGGDAHDAALAAALAETVLLPSKCGLGGDLVALVWRRSADAPEALLAIGGAPAGLAAAATAGQLADTGPLSVGVPGAPLGYVALADRGRLGLAAAVAPAVELARDGACWATINAVLVAESADLLRRHQPDGCTYLPPAGPAAPGAVVRLPGLALALERLAAEGAAVLAGALGRAIVDRVRAAGGVLTLDDLTTARAEWAAPAAVRRGDHRLWATPAPTHGPSLLDALTRLPADRAATPADVHAAVLAAIARRRDELADPSGT